MTTDKPEHVFIERVPLGYALRESEWAFSPLWVITSTPTVGDGTVSTLYLTCEGEWVLSYTLPHVLTFESKVKALEYAQGYTTFSPERTLVTPEDPKVVPFKPEGEA